MCKAPVFPLLFNIIHIFHSFTLQDQYFTMSNVKQDEFN